MAPIPMFGSLEDPAALLEVDDHVAGCPVCRAMLGQSGLSKALISLWNSLAVINRTDEHPDPDLLSSYSRGQLDEVDRQLLESHFEVCAQCHETCLRRR